MGDQLFGRLNQYFINRDYERIPTDSKTVSMYGIFEHSNLYLINVINLKDGYGLDAERYLEYKQMTMQQFMSNQSEKIVLLNIIITDNADALVETFNYVPDLTEKFIDVIWFVNQETQQLMIPGKQLKSVLGIQKDIRKLLKKQETTFYNIESSNRKAIFTMILFGINVAMWLYTEYIGSSTDSETLLRLGAMYTPYIIEDHEYLRLIQSMFLHIGFLHLAFNMFGLYIFGSRLEGYLKRWQYPVIYIGSGVIGSLASLAEEVLLGRDVISAGASGAIYGLMGSLLVITKILKRPIDGVNTYILWMMFILGIVQSVATPQVNVTAHIGGFVGGILLTLLVLNTSRRSDQEEEGN